MIYYLKLYLASLAVFFCSRYGLAGSHRQCNWFLPGKMAVTFL
jgi:hypothetical protein